MGLAKTREVGSSRSTPAMVLAPVIATASRQTGEAATDRPPTTESFRPGAPEVVTGVVPDGVRNVTFELTGGGTETARVQDNLYRARLRRHATTMTFVGPAGRVSVNL